MPAPVSADEFFAVVERSGLLRENDLDTYRFRSTADPSPPDRIAKWLVMDGRLTSFQVGLLLAGKSRPFFVGPYKVLSRIGSGSMGVVYLCEHREMRRKVAVKILQRRRAQDTVALERFLREARAVAALDHPNVVHALDIGHANDLHYLVMEYINGQSLKELVVEEGALPPLKAANYLRQAALGVQHAHEAGFIHRDIKPSNLMIARTGTVKLLDLGMARFEDAEVDLTQGAAIGNAAYIAPEQALDSHDVDARADIYSLGATFYLALTGRPPVAGAGIVDPEPSASSAPSDFSRLMSVLRRMTACSPAKRYQTAAEVAAELAVWATPAPLHVIEPPAAETVPHSSLSFDGEGGDTATDLEPVTLAFDPPPAPIELPPVSKPHKIAHLAPGTKPWYSNRKWQLLFLGFACAVGLVAAIAGGRKSRSVNEISTERH